MNNTNFVYQTLQVRFIAAVSGYDVTLTEPLEYEHISIDGTFDGRTVQFRGEVGHFTRNVMVQGYRNTQFDTVIEACPAGFNTGETKLIQYIYINTSALSLCT